MATFEYTDRVENIPDEVFAIFEETAVRHVCSIEEVAGFYCQLPFSGFTFQNQRDKDVEKQIKYYMEIYGTLRDLGISHSKIISNAYMLMNILQAVKLMNKPSPDVVIPTDRLIRED